jgi:hypothetical protein
MLGVYPEWVEWELWLDYHRRDGDGLTHGNVRNAAPDVVLTPGQCVVVGNEDADLAVAEVVSIDERGVVLVRVLPGSVADHGDRVSRRRAGAG